MGIWVFKANFIVIPPIFFWDISVKNKKGRPHGGATGKIRGSPMWVRFIRWGSRMSEKKFHGNPSYILSKSKWKAYVHIKWKFDPGSNVFVVCLEAKDFSLHSWELPFCLEPLRSTDSKIFRRGADWWAVGFRWSGKRVPFSFVLYKLW